MKEPPLDLNNFKVGQEAELKSFETGFRGAWFRFKIIDIKLKENKITLKYLDYDDGIEMAEIYKVPPYARKSNSCNKQLMIRPCYPFMYHKNTMPSVISEVSVVTNGSWEVEDLVDVYIEGCYWSGRVTKVLSEDKVQIEYPLPPAGEGKEDGTYEAFFKDLRPSLVWSQEEGWTLPTMDGRTAGDAQLIFPSQKGTDSEKEEVDDAEAVHDSPLDAYGTSASNGTGISVDSCEKQIQSSEAKDATVCEGMKMDDVESVDSISIMGVQESNTAATAATAALEEGSDYSIDLNVMHEDTPEAPILDLEELANKIRWLKRILHSH